MTRVLVLTDRLDSRGGALPYLLDVIGALTPHHPVTVASAGGSPDRLGLSLPAGTVTTKIRALGAPDGDPRDLDALRSLLDEGPIVITQNVMNAPALALLPPECTIAVVQDHRVFCPGPGRTLPDGVACAAPFERADCSVCLPEPAYRARMLGLTTARRDALRPFRRVTLSRYMAAELAAAGLPGAQVIPPGVDLGPPRDDPGEGALFAGRLVRHKGADLALQAWRRSGSAAPLKVAGAGALHSIFTDLISNHWQSPGNLRQMMRTSRALLFPARWQEPFGIIGLEALAQGVPVIATDTGGVVEWAEAGVRLVPPGDVRGMAEALAALEADPQGALALGEAGRQAVGRRFSRVAMASSWRALIDATARCAPG